MDLDKHLAKLAALPVPDLSSVHGAALSHRALARARQSRALTGSALSLALGIGVIGGLQTPARAQADLVPFGPPASLTPLIALGQE